MSVLSAVLLTVVAVAVGIYLLAVFAALAIGFSAREAFAGAARVTVGLLGVLIAVGAVVIYLSIVWSGVAS